jgi:hypothetical protein
MNLCVALALRLLACLSIDVALGGKLRKDEKKESFQPEPGSHLSF